MNEEVAEEVVDLLEDTAPEETEAAEVEEETAEEAPVEEEQEERGAGDNSKNALHTYLERIENLEEEKKDIAEDIKLVKQEAVAAGYDRKMIQEMLKLRAMDAEKRLEHENLRDTYIDELSLLL